MKPSKKWLKMAGVYKLFNSSGDFSEAAMVEMYEWESKGIGNIGKALFNNRGICNGYAVGKKWLDVMISMWRRDISDGLLHPYELYVDGKFPYWWLDRVLK